MHGQRSCCTEKGHDKFVQSTYVNKDRACAVLAFAGTLFTEGSTVNKESDGSIDAHMICGYQVING